MLPTVDVPSFVAVVAVVAFPVKAPANVGAVTFAGKATSLSLLTEYIVLLPAG